MSDAEDRLNSRAAAVIRAAAAKSTDDAQFMQRVREVLQIVDEADGSPDESDMNARIRSSAGR